MFLCFDFYLIIGISLQNKLHNRVWKSFCMSTNNPVLLTPLTRATERGAVAVYVATIACTCTAGTWRVRSITSRCLSTLASEHCVNKPIVNIKKTYKYWNQTQTTIWRACDISANLCVVNIFCLKKIVIYFNVHDMPWIIMPHVRSVHGELECESVVPSFTSPHLNGNMSQSKLIRNKSQSILHLFVKTILGARKQSVTSEVKRCVLVIIGKSVLWTNEVVIQNNMLRTVINRNIKC